MKALILVDIQNDFLPGGALAVPRGDQVVPIANKLMPSFEFVAATQDWHPANHGSFASQHAGRRVGDVIKLAGLDQVLWPDHCIQHTPGAAFAPGLHISRITHVVHKGTDPTIDSYSGFFDNGQRKSTGLAEYLAKHSVDEVVVMGLATDYCVKATVIDARRLGFQTQVVLDGIRGVELKPGDCAIAVDQMLAAGAHIVTSADLAPA